VNTREEGRDEKERAKRAVFIGCVLDVSLKVKSVGNVIRRYSMSSSLQACSFNVALHQSIISHALIMWHKIVSVYISVQ